MPGDFYNRNRLFDLTDKVSNRDNCLYPYTLLKNRLFEMGYTLATSDINSPTESDIVIYSDMPKKLPKKNDVRKSYLILFETEVIRADNWEISRHQWFNKIFTWNDDFIDHDKYIKINFPNTINLFDKQPIHEKLCTLIAGRKLSTHRQELYSKRLEAIRWFEKHQPNDFDLYGIGWASGYFQLPRYLGFLNRIKPLTNLMAQKFPSYKGQVQSKKEILEKYKFSICFENVRDMPGYITEKIFDCFFAGCVPIYFGASNIEDHIPLTCFIDFRKFNDFNSLYIFIKEMSDTTYQEYLLNIRRFLESEAILSFSSEYFAETIVNTIREEIGI